MRPKDKKACFFFLVFSLAIWQLGETIKAICLKDNADVLNNAVFSITYSQNTGAAWSILQGKTTLLIVISAAILAISIIYIYKEVTFKDKFPLLSISILAGGILGNMLERINLGYVIDYIKLNFIDFPIFNIFDTMICVGIGLYFLSEVYNEIKKKNDKKNNKN